MAVDLKWRDACLASRAFTDVEMAAGWPAAMTPEQLAGIQRPHLKSDIEARNRKWALIRAIVDAVKAGELPAGKEVAYVSRRQTEGSRRAQEAWKMWKASGRSNFNYDFRSIPGRDHCPPAAYEDVHRTRNDILPADFAAWLHAQGEEPGVHVRNWFEARSVAWPPVVGADWLPDAGAVSGTKVATLDDLRAALKSHPRSKPWPDEWVVLLRAEFSDRGGWVRRANGSRYPNSKIAEQLGEDIDRTRQAVLRYLKEPPGAWEATFDRLTPKAAGRQ